MIRIYKDADDKKLLSELLIQNIEFLMGKNLSFLRDVIFKEISESIEEIITRDYNADLPLESTNYLDNDKTSLELVSTKSNIYDNIISRSYTHGLYHTIISYLNSRYGSDIVRENQFMNNLAVIKNYNGMLHIIDAKGEHFTAGNMFLEVFIDFISFLTDNQQQEGFNINDYILGNRKIEDVAASDYNPLFSLVRLMLVAFNRDPEFNYQSHISNGIITSTFTGDNNQTVLRNNFFDGILINPIIILDTWDLVMGEGDYIDFAYYTDGFFNKYLEFGDWNKKYLIEILQSISRFAKKHYQFLLDNEIIDLAEYQKLNSYYDKVYKEIRREFLGFRVRSSRIFKRIISNNKQLCKKYLQNEMKTAIIKSFKKRRGCFE